MSLPSLHMVSDAVIFKCKAFCTFLHIWCCLQARPKILQYENPLVSAHGLGFLCNPFLSNSRLPIHWRMENGNSRLTERVNWRLDKSLDASVVSVWSMVCGGTATVASVFSLLGRDGETWRHKNEKRGPDVGIFFTVFWLFFLALFSVAFFLRVLWLLVSSSSTS